MRIAIEAQRIFRKDKHGMDLASPPSLEGTERTAKAERR